MYVRRADTVSVDYSASKRSVKAEIVSEMLIVTKDSWKSLVTTGNHRLLVIKVPPSTNIS